MTNKKICIFYIRVLIQLPRHLTLIATELRYEIFRDATYVAKQNEIFEQSFFFASHTMVDRSLRGTMRRVKQEVANNGQKNSVNGTRNDLTREFYSHRQKLKRT